MLQTLFQQILNFGVANNDPEERLLTRFFNGMMLLTILLGMCTTSIALYFDLSTSYLIINLLITGLYIPMLYLSYLGYIYAIRLILALVIPFLISFCYLMIGGFFSQGAATLAAVIFAYVGFRRRPQYRKWINGLALLMFVAVAIYHHFNGPVLETIDFPFDEIVVLGAGIAWGVGLLILLEKEMISVIDRLGKKNKQLASKTEELERFTYIASHDLKSPLITINAFVNLVEKDLKNGNVTEGLKKLNYVKTGAKQMTYLVEDILEITKLEKERTSTRKTLNLNDILNKAKINLLAEIEQRNAIIQADHLSNYLANEVEMVLIFQNFIQNAIKYNDSTQPIVKIKTQETNSHILLSFEDNGIGIEEKYHDQIFQFFKRLHNNNEYQGTGLGLGLCKKIMDGYNGQITVNSSPQQGTTFTLEFPKVHELVELP